MVCLGKFLGSNPRAFYGRWGCPSYHHSLCARYALALATSLIGLGSGDRLLAHSIQGQPTLIASIPIQSTPIQSTPIQTVPVQISPIYISQSSPSQPPRFLINIPMANKVAYRDLMAQAESLVINMINRQFQQNPALSQLEVVVMGDRHGEQIPLSSTIVSRQQWRNKPIVSAWSNYYGASYALLNRHQTTTVAAAPRTPSTSVPRDRAAQVQEAYDAGRLTGPEAQRYLDDLD